MSLEKESPSWIAYKSYFLKRSKGLNPRHLYDGYEGEGFIMNGGPGPFSKSSLDMHHYDSDDADVTHESPTQKFPKDTVKLLSPTQASLDKAKSQLRTQREKELKEESKTSMLPPDGVIYDPDRNPHIDTAPTAATQPVTSFSSDKVVKLGKKRTNKLSLSEIRQKLLESPGWKRPKMS